MAKSINWIEWREREKEEENDDDDNNKKKWTENGKKCHKITAQKICCCFHCHVLHLNELVANRIDCVIKIYRNATYTLASKDDDDDDDENDDKNRFDLMLNFKIEIVHNICTTSNLKKEAEEEEEDIHLLWKNPENFIHKWWMQWVVQSCMFYDVQFQDRK